MVIPIRQEDAEQLSSIPSTGSTATLPDELETEPGSEDTNTDADDGSRVASVFEPTVPVPMHVPASRYRGRDRPFFYMED